MRGFQFRILALLGFWEFRGLSLQFTFSGFRVSSLLLRGLRFQDSEIGCLGVGLQDFELRALEVRIWC